DNIGSLVGKLVSSSIVYGRCRAFEQVVGMKEPFDLSKGKGYHSSYKKDHTQSSNNIATATFPWLDEFVADPSAPIKDLLLKKPPTLQRPTPLRTQVPLVSSQRDTPSSVRAFNSMSPHVEELKQDRREVVSKVVPYAVMELIHSDDIVSLLGKLVSSAIVYGRCKAFEQVAGMKEPFDLSKLRGYNTIPENDVAKDDRGRIKEVDKKRGNKEIASIEEAYYRTSPQTDDMVKEVHEGSCGFNSEPRSMVVRITKQGYCWPSMHQDVAKVDVKPLTVINGRHAQRIVWEYVVCKFSVPQTINSKDEKHFQEGIFADICKGLKVTQSFFPITKHIEIMNHIVKQLARSQQGWVDDLAQVLDTPSSVRASNSMSPHVDASIVKSQSSPPQ
nr:protein NYNRIN-like [Tanacetum cinerariifolium]